MPLGYFDRDVRGELYDILVKQKKAREELERKKREYIPPAGAPPFGSHPLDHGIEDPEARDNMKRYLRLPPYHNKK